MFNTKKREVYNLLELTPVRVNEHEENEGLIRILVPKFKNKFLLSLIPKGKSKHIRVKLDEIGTATWLLINGKRKVTKIIEELREKFGDNLEPAEERVSKFIGGLNLHNLIYFKELKKDK
ncbi:MAG: PqqD family protein [Bacteroidetes bacterium]|nr:PqqD family protein [Bacteroidota bacterium]